VLDFFRRNETNPYDQRSDWQKAREMVGDKIRSAHLTVSGAMDRHIMLSSLATTAVIAGVVFAAVAGLADAGYITSGSSASDVANLADPSNPASLTSPMNLASPLSKMLPTSPMYHR